METYTEIWEKDARWLMGPGILGDVIKFLRNKAPVVLLDENNPNQINLSIPLPKMRDEISGELVSVFYFIPEELQGLFVDRLNLVTKDWYDERADRVLRSKLGHAVSKDTVSILNNQLFNIEHERAFYDDDPLWVVAASRFGFSRLAVPKPAGIAR